MLDLFDNQLCALRWTRDYFQQSHRVFCPYPVHVSDVTVNTISSTRVLSQQEKYHKVYSIAQKLADIASDISTREFGYAVECLQQIATAWEQGKHVFVEVINDDGIDEGEIFKEGSDSNDLANNNINDAIDHVGNDNFDESKVFKDSLVENDIGIVDDIADDYVEDDDDVYIQRENTDDNHINDNITSDDHITVENNSAVVKDCLGDVTDEKDDCDVYKDNADCGVKDGMNIFDVERNTMRTDHVDESCESETEPMSPIKLPPKVKMRGRPKGAGLTVIGLPRKKKNGNKHPVKFLMKPSDVKEKQILSWMLSDDLVKKALNGELIDIQEVPSDTIRMSPCLLDENVNWKVVQKYFAKGTWMMMRDLVHRLSIKPNWVCGVCQDDLEHSHSVVCESCLIWYHLKCVGLNNPPKKTNWFCRFCYEKCEPVSENSENKVSS